MAKDKPEASEVEVVPTVTERTNMQVDLEMKVTRDDVIDAVISDEEERIEELFEGAHGALCLFLDQDGEAHRAVQEKLNKVRERFKKLVEKKLRAKHRKLLTALKGLDLEEDLQISDGYDPQTSDEEKRLRREINILLWPEHYKTGFRRKRNVNYSDWSVELGNDRGRYHHSHDSYMFNFNTSLPNFAQLTLSEKRENRSGRDGEIHVTLRLHLSEEEILEALKDESPVLEHLREAHNLCEQFAVVRDQAIELSTMGKRAKGAMVRQFLGTTSQGQKILGSIDNVRRRGGRLLAGALDEPKKKETKKKKK